MEQTSGTADGGLLPVCPGGNAGGATGDLVDPDCGLRATAGGAGVWRSGVAVSDHRRVVPLGAPPVGQKICVDRRLDLPLGAGSDHHLGGGIYRHLRRVTVRLCDLSRQHADHLGGAAPDDDGHQHVGHQKPCPGGPNWLLVRDRQRDCAGDLPADFPPRARSRWR